MKNHVGGRLKIMDVNEYLNDMLLPRLDITASRDSVAVHPVCSVRKMGLQEKLRAVAGACAREVTMPDEVLCCGCAGDKGWMTPELNEHALRDLKRALPAGCSSGYSSSRTCEIGLSEHSGVPYRSIIYLVESCAEAVGEPAATAEPAESANSVASVELVK